MREATSKTDAKPELRQASSVLAWRCADAQRASRPLPWLADCRAGGMLASSPEATAHSAPDIQLEQHGAGALLQRDYWAAIDHCRVSPRELMSDLRLRFCEFPPAELVSFPRTANCDQPLTEGDELEIVIRMAGECRVRVTGCDDHSLTFSTLK